MFLFITILSVASYLLSGVLSVEVHEDMREAANNLVKHFHKPEQEVCDCNTVCVPLTELLHNTGPTEIKTENVSVMLQSLKGK